MLQVLRGSDEFVFELFILRKRADELVDYRYVGGVCRADGEHAEL